MKKITKIIALTIAGLLLTLFSVSASKVTGTLTTGLTTGVEGVVVGPPVASPGAGTYASVQTVTLSAQGTLTIGYTTDGTNPTCPGTYSGAISVGSSQIIKAISCYPNDISSSIASYAYMINIPVPPPVAPGGGGGGGGQPPTSKPGDANNDSLVNILDFNTMMMNWGKTGSGNSGDFNSDGKVDILDFNILMINWS